METHKNPGHSNSKGQLAFSGTFSYLVFVTAEEQRLSYSSDDQTPVYGGSVICLECLELGPESRSSVSNMVPMVVGWLLPQVTDVRQHWYLKEPCTRCHCSESGCPRLTGPESFFAFAGD